MAPTRIDLVATPDGPVASTAGDQVPDTTTGEAEPADRPRRRPLRALAVVVAGMSVLATTLLVRAQDERHARELRSLDGAIEHRDALFDRVVKVVSAQTDLDPDVVTGEGLRPLDQLAGTGRQVTASDRQALQQATVRLGRRRHAGTTWSPTCTGILVARGDGVFVASARECFVHDLPFDEEYVEDDDDSSWFVDPPAEVQEIGGDLPYVYGVLDPAASADAPRALTALRHIVASTDWSGWVVASLVDPGDLAVRAIEAERLAGAPGLPAGGQGASTSSFPKGRRSTQVHAEGVYLGRIFEQVSASTGRATDLVAIEPDPDHLRDACSPGALGAGAVLADGYVLGPLTARNTLGRGPDRELAADEWDGRYERLRMEGELGIDIPDDLVVCSYSAVDQLFLDRLWRLLDASDGEA